MYIGNLRKAGIVVVSSNSNDELQKDKKIRIVNNDTRGNNFILWLRA